MNYDDADQNTCCCGAFRTKLETGTRVIATIGIVLSVIYAIVNIFWLHNIGNVVTQLIVAAIYFLVLYGLKNDKPSLFLPFLIVMAINLIFCTLAAVFFAICAIWAPQQLIDYFEKLYPETADKIGFRTLMAVCAISMSIGTALCAWFYSVIYRTYKLLKKTLASGYVPPPV